MYVPNIIICYNSLATSNEGMICNWSYYYCLLMLDSNYDYIASKNLH